MKEKITQIMAVFAFIATIGIANISPLTASAAADTCTWTGTTSVNWSDGSNWTGCDNGGVPENGDTLNFPVTASNKSMNNDLAGLSPEQLVINGSGYTLAGNALTNTTSGNFISASESATINLQIAFNGANTGATVSAGKILTFAQPQAFGSAFGQYWTGGGTVTFNGNLTGSTGGMFRAENSTIVKVNGATNTFTSNFVGAESNASFECHSSTCFGDNANRIYMGGGIVSIVGSYVFSNNFATSTSTPNLSKLTADDDVSITGDGSVVDDLSIEQSSTSKGIQFTGNTTLTGSVSVYGADTTSDVKFDSALSGAGNVTVESGKAWMSAPSNFTGTLTVKSGAVAMADQINSLGATSAPTIIESGGSLELDSPSPVTIAEPIQIAGEGVNPASYKGAIYGASTSDDVTLTGNITLSNNAKIYNDAVGDFITLSGVISGSHDLTYEAVNGSYLQVDGTSANIYTGTTTFTGGTTYLEKALAIPGNLTLNSSSPGTNAVTVYTYAPNAIADTSVVTLTNSTDQLRVGDSGSTEVIGGLIGPAGIISFQYNDSDLAIDQDFNSTFGGKFYADGGSPTITKRGTGNLLLTGGLDSNLDKDINFIVEEGTMTVNGDLSTTNGGTDLTVETNGTLKGTGTVGNLTANGGKIAGGNSPGTLHATTLTMNSATTFEQEISGYVAGTEYDQFIASGAVNLGNANLSIVPSYTPAANQTFTIITGSSISGTFNGLANGSTVKSKGITFRINYNATTVTLTYVSGTYDPNATDSSLANTGTSMLLAALASVMLIATATALATRRPRAQSAHSA